MQCRAPAPEFPTFALDARDLPETCGIYAIRNVHTGRRYVGKTGGSTRSARTFRRRCREHARNLELARGQHREGALQEDFKVHGLAGFVFEVLEVMDPGTSIAQAYAREQHWINLFDAAGTGYNRVPFASSGADGYRHTEEQLAKRRATLALPDVKARKVASLKAAYGTPEARAAVGQRSREVRARPGVKEGMRAAMRAAAALPEERARKQAASLQAMEVARAARITQLRREIGLAEAAGAAALATIKAAELEVRLAMAAMTAAGVHYTDRRMTVATVKASTLKARASKVRLDWIAGRPVKPSVQRRADSIWVKLLASESLPGA